MNHSKSILDQVDEYLHDNDPNTHTTFMESEKDAMTNSQLYTGNWLSDDIQLDLDHLGETFFNNHNNNTHGNDPSRHDIQPHPLESAPHNDHGMNGGSHLNHQQFNLLDQTNGSMSKNTESNMLNKTSHFASIHSDLVFSPSASPLVAAGQSNMGLQVTPFMNPQVLMGSNSANVSNINTPYLRESGAPNMNGDKSAHTSTKPTPLISHYSPLISPAVNDSQMYSSTNFALPDSAVEPMQNSNNNNNHHSSGNNSNTSSGRNNSNNSAKLPKTKKSSSSSRGKRISFSSSTGTSGKQNFNGSTSKVRKNSPYMSASRSRRNYQELKNKNGSTIANSDSSGNTPVGNNNSTTPTNASWDDMVFKLPESSTAVISAANNSNNSGETPDSGGSKESSLTLSHFAVANKILPGSFDNNDITNGFDQDNKMTNKMISIPLQTSIETTESWKQRINNSDKTRSSNSLSNSGTPPKHTKSDNMNISVSPAMKPRKGSKVLSENGSSTNLTKVKSRSESKSGKKDDSKKEVHKVAEQERRNRLNSALNDLSGLIPDELKETISIPSKATTAELACLYIRSLQEQIQKLEQDRGSTHH